MRLRGVAVLSLVFTYLFFFEYLPPFRWVHIPYDLEYYHYPLDDFAFQELRAGHIPEWDSAIDSGISFIGNPQSALLYPPMWVAFAYNIGDTRLKYGSLQALVTAHIWLAFLFCFIWLRDKKLGSMAAALGAGVFAYSGYALLQLQHFGLICAYTWLPLGFWSIDQASASRDWRPLWKMVLAGAFCTLAGYPPAAVVCLTLMLTYASLAIRGWKVRAWVAGAVAVSTLLCMVQLLPGWEAAALKEPHGDYGSGIHDPRFYLSYFIPNFFDFGLHTSVWTNHGYEYLYLGPAALFGLACLLAGGRSIIRRTLPLLGVGLVAAILVTNPHNLVWHAIRHSQLLAQVCRSWYFLAGITAAVAGLAAVGLARFLDRRSGLSPRWLAPACLTVVGVWAAVELWRWDPDGPGFSTGWKNSIDAAITLAVFCIVLYSYRAAGSRTRPWLAAGLLLAVGIDYKANGTSKRVNTEPGHVDHRFARAAFPGMPDQTYRELFAHRDFRIAVDSTDPGPTNLRHFGLASPQGGDPLTPAQYHKVLAPAGAWYDHLDIDPANRELLRLLGVRYYITAEGQSRYLQLKTDPAFRLLQPDAYFKVFEFAGARPGYYWEHDLAGNRARCLSWSPADRELQASSRDGGKFIFIEQFFPGWQATVDGRPVSIERWQTAFQAIQVPPGEHRIRFTYKSRSFRIGAAITGATLAALLLCAMLSGLERTPSAHETKSR